MAWYDFFSRFYDAALEPLYAEHRELAADALDLRPGSVVLDVPCGTGQSLHVIAQRAGPGCRLIGADLSAGMLQRARERTAAHGLGNLCLLQADASTLDAPALQRAAEAAVHVDRLHVFLGMSLFPDMHATFANLWSLLAPGGRCVLVDVHAERLGLRGRAVNAVARADIRRRFWEPLERVAPDFALRDLPRRKEHGGQIMLATGCKP